MNAKVFLAAAAVVLLAQSCGESEPPSSKPSPSARPAAPAVPVPRPDTAPPGLAKIVMVADWQDRHLVRVHREITVSVAAVQVNGKLAKYQPYEGGPLLPGPQVTPTFSPWRDEALLMPGISYIAWTITYRYVTQGDILRCWAEVPGKPHVPIPGTLVEKQIIGPYRDAIIRLAEITCTYHKGA